MTKDDDDTLCYRSELEAAVKAAVEAEREACAKVAENRMLLDASAKENVAHHTACKNIAADIRARGQA
jgi:ferredoxin